MLFRSRLLEPVRASGLGCEACNNFFPGSIRLTGPEADHPSALAYAASALKLAQSLGISVIVFGSGKARTPPEGFSIPRARDQLLVFTRLLADLAADNGIIIAMEHLNRGESNILTTFSDVVRFVAETEKPAVRALLDTFHLELEKEPASDILDGHGFIAHTHTARLTGRTWPQRATPELSAAFSALAATGYDGRMSVEASSENLAADCAGTLAVLKKLEKEAVAR